jgi:type IV secretory pathway TraG/TraD family ATPase VirD4
MILDIYFLAGSVLYLLADYLFLHMHISGVTAIAAVALLLDLCFISFVLFRFFEKQVTWATIAITIVPFYGILKTIILRISALPILQNIQDPALLLIAAIPFIYFVTDSKSRKGEQKRPAGRTNIKIDKDDLGDYPIEIVPGLFLPTHDRFTHTQVIGSTGSGKTRYVFFPWIYQDIKNGAGVFILDIKSNMKENVLKFVTNNKKARDHDFFCFSLGDLKSDTYNPLAGDDSSEIVNRVVSTLYYDNSGHPYYVKTQKRFLRLAIALLHKEWGTLIFEDLYNAAINPEKYFKIICAKNPDDINAKDMLDLLKEPKLLEILTDLKNILSTYVTAKWAPQINKRNPDIDIEDIVKNNRVLLFQVNAINLSEDYRAIARLIMMHLNAEIGKRYVVKAKVPFFMYLDEFYNILYPAFPDLINKAREANVGLIFGHQALGDLIFDNKKEIQNIILTNSRNKIVLNIEDPDTAEYFARAWGTYTVVLEHTTYSAKNSWNETNKSFTPGERFIVHPNDLKNLILGKGFVKLETKGGKVIREVTFPDADFNKIKTHRLHVFHRKKAEIPDPQIRFEPETKPQQSIKGRFSTKDAAKNAPKDIKEALKNDIPEETDIEPKENDKKKDKDKDKDK